MMSAAGLRQAEEIRGTKSMLLALVPSWVEEGVTSRGSMI